MSFIDKSKYKIFSFGKVYDIDEKCLSKVSSLHEYKELIWSYKPAIIIPIIIFSMILSFILIIFTNKNFDLVHQYTFWMATIFYILISIIYYIKLKKAINCK